MFWRWLSKTVETCVHEIICTKACVITGHYPILGIEIIWYGGGEGSNEQGLQPECRRQNKPAQNTGTDTENSTTVCWMRVWYWPWDWHSPVFAGDVGIRSYQRTWKQQKTVYKFWYKLPFAKWCTRALLTYLLTYSTEQSPSWEANSFCS